MQRPEGQGLDEALADINARLLAAATPLQREIFETSTLDEALLAAERDDGGPAVPIGSARSTRCAPSCRAGARAWRCRRPTSRPTAAARCATSSPASCGSPPSRRSTSASGSSSTRCSSATTPTARTTLAGLLELLDTGLAPRRLRPGGARGRAATRRPERALTRYHARLHEQDSEPVWFERAFSFRLGPHHLRGRVDRVDRLAAGGEAEYELIDYKTSRPKSTEQLRDDVQLSLYALAAREDWQLESSRQAYYYVLDDVRVPVPRDERDADAVRGLVLEVGEGILAQEFEPTPSPAACSICDYRIVCPAAEA